MLYHWRACCLYIVVVSRKKKKTCSGNEIRTIISYLHWFFNAIYSYASRGSHTLSETKYRIGKVNIPTCKLILGSQPLRWRQLHDIHPHHNRDNNIGNGLAGQGLMHPQQVYNEVQCVQVLVVRNLLYGCENKTLLADTERRIQAKIQTTENVPEEVAPDVVQRAQNLIIIFFLRGMGLHW